MSADLPRPRRQQAVPRAQAIKSNRRQVMLFALLTLLLSVATVWGGRALLRDSETLTFAVGNPAGEGAQFAAKLADILKSNSSRFRLKIVNSSDSAKIGRASCRERV